MKKIFKMLISMIYPMFISLFLTFICGIIVSKTEGAVIYVGFKSSIIDLIQVSLGILTILFFVAFVVGFIGYILCEIKDIKKEKSDK